MKSQNRNPGELLELSGAFWQTCVLHAAVKLDVFTAIGDQRLPHAPLLPRRTCHKTRNTISSSVPSSKPSFDLCACIENNSKRSSASFLPDAAHQVMLTIGLGRLLADLLCCTSRRKPHSSALDALLFLGCTSRRWPRSPAPPARERRILGRRTARLPD